MPTIVEWTSFWSIFAVLFVALLSVAQLHAEETKLVTTTITVGEMCGGCVKRITAHFDKVKEVA